MYVIVGLGNPGKKYQNTRHNMGFITVDHLAAKHNIKVNKIAFKALVGDGIIANQRVVLVKPQTYMNLSGQSVREVLSYYKVGVENLILIYDDIDIETGKLRIRKKGSAGSHNGMKSVIYDIKSEDFPRIRIGIGGERKMTLRDFVTGGFNKEEKPLLEDAVERAARAVEIILTEGTDAAMNRYNG